MSQYLQDLIDRFKAAGAAASAPNEVDEENFNLLPNQQQSGGGLINAAKTLIAAAPPCSN